MKPPSDKTVSPLLVRRRKRRKGKRFSQRLFAACTRLCVCLLALLVVVWVVSAVSRPFVLNRQEKREIRRLCAQIADTEKNNAALRDRIRVLNSPKGIEVEARRLGWVRPGEILIQTSSIPRPAKNVTAGAAAATPALGAVRAQGGVLRRALDETARALAGLGNRFATPAKQSNE